MNSNASLTLSGVIPPLATPLDHGRLDLLGLERLIEYVLSGEVYGLFVLGTTGEGPALNQAIQRELVEEAVAIAADRVPVIAGVSHPCLDEAIDTANAAAKVGAKAVAATPPYYFPMGDASVRCWFEQLADRSPLPVMLYNFPGLAKVAITPDTSAALQQHPNIIGIKDSSGDMEGFAKFCLQKEQRSDWSVLIGPEERLADAIALGADGGVCGGANLRPQLYVDWYRAAVAQDQSEVERLRNEVEQFIAATYGNPITCESVIHGLKRGLAEAGICNAETTWPSIDMLAPTRIGSAD